MKTLVIRAVAMVSFVVNHLMCNYNYNALFMYMQNLIVIVK